MLVFVRNDLSYLKGSLAHDVSQRYHVLPYRSFKSVKMRVTNVFLVALSAAAVQSRSHRREDRPEKPGPNDATPRRYIIELNSRAQSAQVVAKAADIPGLKVVKHFDSDIFPAVSVDCTGACDAQSLKVAFQGPTDEGSSAIAHVYKSQMVELVPPVEELDPGSVAANAAGPNTTIHQATGVQSLHDAGILGEGATIAVVDSGIQYTHPAVRILHIKMDGPRLLTIFDTAWWWIWPGVHCYRRS